MVTLSLSKPTALLYYSEEPLISSDLDSTIIELSPAELINRPAFTRKDLIWTDDIMLPDDIAPTQEDLQKIDLLLRKTISSDNFVVCNMELAGYGAFAYKPIRKGQILFYSGQYIRGSSENISVYAALVNVLDCVDAEHIGGMASMLLDLFPLKTALLPMCKRVVSLIGAAKNNFTLKLLTLSFGSLPYLEAIEDIRPYTQCGFDYGEKYWRSMKEFQGKEKLFFNKKGKVIVGEDADVLRKIASIQPRENSIMQASKKLKEISTFP